ncbi:MAG: hypothetical protein ACI8PZ_005441 [Myxococcota bacterium]|jgi:hypothetical protein
MRALWWVVLAGCGTGTNGWEAPPGDASNAEAEAPDLPGDSNEAPIPVGNTRALMGGGLTIAHGLAVGANAAAGRLHFVDVEGGRRLDTIELGPDSVPFRIALAEHEGYVSLRGTGEIAVFDTLAITEVDRWSVCAEPRGLAVDGDLLHVACASGALLALDRATGDEVRRVLLPNDLRDIVVEGDDLWVSRFRAAEVLRVNAAGKMVQRQSPPVIQYNPQLGSGEQPFSASVGWRLTPNPAGGVVLLHQRGLDGALDVVIDVNAQVYYASDERCESVVVSSATAFDSDGVVESWGLFAAPQVLDGFVDGNELVIASAGAEFLGAAQQHHSIRALQSSVVRCNDGPGVQPEEGRLVAVARADSGHIVRMTQAPFTMTLNGRTIVYMQSPTSSAFDMFHGPTTDAGLSCASCHPEGNDDGRVWRFEAHGPRRTHNLAVGLSGMEPFHWSGDMETMQELLVEVFEGRMMSGPDRIRQDSGGVMVAWLDAQLLHQSEPQLSADEVAAGQTLFWSEAVGCGTCHYGDAYSDGLSWDVGTGRMLQTPSLRGIGARGPYLHSGCADTLEARFSPECTTDFHGTTSHLEAAEVGALVAYLHTL